MPLPTPGPWVVKLPADATRLKVEIYSYDYGHVGWFEGPRKNLPLVAVAPDLLRELKFCVDHLPTKYAQACERMRLLISRAENPI